MTLSYPTDLTLPGAVTTLLAFHKGLYGTARMELEDGEQPPSDPSSSDSGQQQEPPADDQLGDGGKRALAAEREARKNLERQLKAQQQASKDQLAAIAKALGVNDSGGSGEDPMQSLQNQMASLLRENAVEKLARQKGITDDGDIALLAAVNDTDARAKLADRLSKAAAAPTGVKGVRPDKRQGAGDGLPVPGQAGRDEAARRFGKKQ